MSKPGPVQSVFSKIKWVDILVNNAGIASIGNVEATTPEEIVEKLSRYQPIGRMGQPREIAALAAFLCSDEAAFITGAALPVLADCARPMDDFIEAHNERTAPFEWTKKALSLYFED